MKRIVLALLLSLVTGCTCVDADVLSGIERLDKNTHDLSVSYGALLERTPAPAPLGEQTPEQAAAEWADHVDHEKALMTANNALSEKVLEWARVRAGEQE